MRKGSGFSDETTIDVLQQSCMHIYNIASTMKQRESETIFDSCRRVNSDLIRLNRPDKNCK